MQLDSQAAELVRTDNAWGVVAGATIGLILSLGTLTTYTVGVFVQPLSAEFGWTRTQLLLGIAISQYVLAFSAPVWGYLVDRIGPRPSLLASIACMAACLASFALLKPPLWHYYLLYALVAVAGGAASPIGYCAVVARRFDRTLGLALGTCLMGVGLGAAALPITAQTLTADFGWRGAYAVLGAATFLITVPAALYATRGLPAGRAVRQGPSVPIRPMLRSRTFILLCCSFFILGAVSIGTLVNLVPVMIGRGIAPYIASGIASVTGVTVIFGRAGIGWFLDRLRPAFVVACVALVAAAALLLLAFGQGLTAAYATAILLGAVVGAEVDFTAFFVRRHFGQAAFGRLYGIAFAVFIFGNGTGPILASASSDRFGSFQVGAVLFAAAVLLVIPLMLALPPPSATLPIETRV